MSEGDPSAEQRPDTPKDPLVGKVLDGRFEVIAAIGSGGMGKVYKAVQKPLDRMVALKVLNTNYAAGRDPGFVKRFFNEAAQTAKLSHPNTITVHDYGQTEDGIFYIAMELVDGVALSDVINREGALPIQRALHIVGQIARSLREAHKLGLIHRDLKPANVMLLQEDTDHDRVKVLDFGLVKTFMPERPNEPKVDETALTQAGVVMGSPLYMAPEQARGEADPRSDIYSLGVVLFQMLTGRPPFQSKDSIDVIVKHLNEMPPRLKSVRADLDFPPEVEALVAMLLEKKPEDRPQTMDELLEALRAAGMNSGLSGVFSSPRTGVVSSPRVKAVPPPLPGSRTMDSGEPIDVELSQPVKSPQKLGTLIALFVGAVILGGAVVAFSVSGEDPAPANDSTVVIAPIEPTLPKHVVVPKKDDPKPLVETPKAPLPVLFVVESDPAGAQVFRGEKLLGKTPFKFEKPPDDDGVARDELTFVLDGYVKETTAASGVGAEVMVKERLKKKPAVGNGKKRPPPRDDGYKDDPYQ